MVAFAEYPAMAQNLLRNGDFAQESVVGLPLEWEFRQFSSASTEKVLRLKGNGYAVQSNIAMTPGDYTLTYTVRGDGTEYRAYCEWITPPDHYSASDVSFRKSTPDWETVTIAFTYTSGANPPYLALQVHGEGVVEFRDVSVTPAQTEGETPAVLAETPAKMIDLPLDKWKLTPPSKRWNDGGKDVLFTECYQKMPSTAILTNLSLAPGKSYSLHFKVKCVTTNTVNDIFRSYGMRVYFGNCSTPFLSPWDDTWANYQTKKIDFTVPEKSDGMTSIGLTAGQGGILFDAFQLEEKTNVEKEKFSVILSSPCYRDCIYSTMPVTEISGTVTAADGITPITIQLLNADQQSLSGENLENKGQPIAFSLPVSDLNDGTCSLVISSGKEKPLIVPIQKLAPAPYEVTFDANKICHINGEPFFPILFWSDRLLDKNGTDFIQYASTNGVNAVTVSAGDPKQVREMLDCAERNQMKIILNLNYPRVFGEKDFQYMIHNLCERLSPEVIQHPALLGYFLADEPYWNGTPFNPMKKTYTFVKAWDPYHPIWINAAPRGTIPDHQLYSTAADIYGVDIYPVGSTGHSGLPNKSLSSVGDYVDWMNACVSFRKPIWMVLQGFAWQSIQKDCSDDGTGYPTIHEMRYMLYDSLVKGAQGITWWGTYVTKKTEFVDVLFAATRELNALSPLLIKGEDMGAATVSNPAIATRILIYNGNRYVIAVNRSNEIDHVILDAQWDKRTVYVPHEHRSLPVHNGSIQDEFGPYDVRIYTETEN